jgi:hypothetical protein
MDAGLKSEWKSIVQDIIEFWRGGGGDLKPDPHAGVQDMLLGRPDLVDRVQAFCPKVEFLEILLSICDGRVDDLLYLLQHFVRMLSSHPRMCELLYIHGPRRGGKDVIASLLQAFLGDMDEAGFCAALPGDYFIKRDSSSRSRGSEDSTPMIHSVMRSKAVLVPEVPKGITNMEQVKPLCEQQGVKVATRTHNKDPQRTQPGFQIVMFSNHAMDIGLNPDGGQARRVSVMGLTKVYQAGGDEDRPELKELVNSGKFNVQMFHVAKELYPALDLYSTNIRRPCRIEQETKDVTGELPDGEDPTVAWIHATFEPCVLASRASKEADVKKAVADHFGIGKLRDTKNRMIELGFKLECNDGKGHRFVRYKFDEDDVLKPIRFRSAA